MDQAKSPKLPFILWMDIDTSETESIRRVSCAVIYGGCIKSVDVNRGVYGSETIMSSPTQWLPALLALLDSGIEKWNAAEISRDRATGGLIYNVRHAPKSGLTDIWHPKLIDLRELVNLELADTYWYNLGTELTATYCPTPLLEHTSLLLTSYWTILSSSPRIYLKIAHNDDDLRLVRQETETYEFLSKHDPDVAPKFLGHVHERGNVIGFALEYIEHGYRPKSAADIPRCKAVLQRFHALGLVHGFVDGYSFIVEDRDGQKKARMIHFQYARKCDNRPPKILILASDDQVDFQRLEARLLIMR